MKKSLISSLVFVFCVVSNSFAETNQEAFEWFLDKGITADNYFDTEIAYTNLAKTRTNQKKSALFANDIDVQEIDFFGNALVPGVVKTQGFGAYLSASFRNSHTNKLAYWFLFSSKENWEEMLFIEKTEPVNVVFFPEESGFLIFNYGTQGDAGFMFVDSAKNVTLSGFYGKTTVAFYPIELNDDLYVWERILVAPAVQYQITSWWDAVICGVDGPMNFELTSTAKEVVIGGKYWIQDSAATTFLVKLPIMAEDGCVESSWLDTDGSYVVYESNLSCTSAGVQGTLKQTLGTWCGGTMKYTFVAANGTKTDLFQLQQR